MTMRLLPARTGLVAVLVLLLALPSPPVEAGGRSADKWRAMITSLQPGTPLEVRLHDGTRVTGVLAHVTDEGFTLKGESARDSMTFRYEEPKVVKKVKNWKPGQSADDRHSRVARGDGRDRVDATRELGTCDRHPRMRPGVCRIRPAREATGMAIRSTSPRRRPWRGMSASRLFPRTYSITMKSWPLAASIS
jgi:hypothetical protein